MALALVVMERARVTLVGVVLPALLLTYHVLELALVTELAIIPAVSVPALLPGSQRIANSNFVQILALAMELAMEQPVCAPATSIGAELLVTLLTSFVVEIQSVIIMVSATMPPVNAFALVTTPLFPTAPLEIAPIHAAEMEFVISTQLIAHATKGTLEAIAAL